MGPLNSEATLWVPPELCQDQETPEPSILQLELPSQCLTLGIFSLHLAVLQQGHARV